MKIETKPRDDHQVTLVVELEAEQMEGAKRRAARKISERKSIPGFRPGKAPYDVVVRTLGEGAIVEDAVDLLLDEVYPKAVEEAKLEPGAAGSLEKVENLDKKPRFIFTVPLAPSVDLGDYRAIRMPYAWTEPGADKVDESIEEFRRMYAKTETVERPVQKGDFVMVDLKGTKKDAAEGEAPLIERNSFPVFIREDQKEDEYPFADFSSKLVGTNVNESKSFSHKYPKEYKDESLAGETVQFDVAVKIVRGTLLPDLDDEFAKQVGPFENLQALRDVVKANLAEQSKAEYDDEFFTKVMEAIKEKAVIKYPPQVLDHELEHVMEDLKTRLAGQGLDMVAYLKSREMDEEKFIAEEARPIAVKRLERSLIMDEVAKIEKVELSKELLQSTFRQTLGEYQGDAGFQKMMRGKSQPPKRMMDAVAMESANRAFVQQTLERLKAIATGQAPELPGNEKTEKSVAKKAAPKKTTTKKTDGGKSAAKPAAAKSKQATTGKSTKK